jgi:hypothetical protein
MFLFLQLADRNIYYTSKGAFCHNNAKALTTGTAGGFSVNKNRRF